MKNKKYVLTVEGNIDFAGHVIRQYLELLGAENVVVDYLYGSNSYGFTITVKEIVE